MKYTSRRGVYDSMQILVAAYLESNDGGDYELSSSPFCRNEWEPDMLHASEIGGCPRAVAYRLSHAPEKPRGKASAANRTVMFNTAYFFHYGRYSALSWAGLLESHETTVPLPDGWTGRYDAIFKPDYREERTILYDLKSVLPAALKYSYSFPKPKDCWQLAVYAEALGMSEAMCEYADRAGGVSPVECVIDPREYYGDVQQRMRMMEAARDGLPELPPTLSPVLDGHYTKRRGQPFRELTSIDIKTDYRCNYCDYLLSEKVGTTDVLCADSLCKPYYDPPQTIATFKGGKPVSIEHGHEDAVESWLTGHIVRFDIEDEG